MVIKTILYSKTFPHPVNGQWVKVALEAETTPDDDVRNCLYDLKKQIENFYHESTKHDEKVASEQKTVPDTPQSTEAKDIADILLCKDLKELKTFETFVNGSKSKLIKATYNQKLKQFQDGLEQNKD